VVHPPAASPFSCAFAAAASAAAQPIANAVAEKWQEECRRTSSAANSGRVTAEHGSSSGGGARNPFLSPSPDRQPNGSYNNYNNARNELPGVSDSWGGGWGLSAAGNGAGGFSGRMNAGLGPGGFSNGGFSSTGLQRAEEHFGSMLEAAGQALRAGVAAVTKWLAVRVVWWQQRAGWCELLYR
jgi:hypothetical protein